MLPLTEPGNKVWPTYLPSYTPLPPLPSRCIEIHLTLWPLRYVEEVNHIVIAAVPSVTLPQDDHRGVAREGSGAANPHPPSLPPSGPAELPVCG